MAESKDARIHSPAPTTSDSSTRQPQQSWRHELPLLLLMAPSLGSSSAASRARLGLLGTSQSSSSAARL